MTARIYRVMNRVNRQWVQVAAHTAQEACESAGWQMGDCFILELPLPPGPGKLALTSQEMDYLADCKVRWGVDLTVAEAAECHRILEKWLAAQTWDRRDHHPIASNL